MNAYGGVEEGCISCDAENEQSTNVGEYSRKGGREQEEFNPHLEVASFPVIQERKITLAVLREGKGNIQMS